MMKKTALLLILLLALGMAWGAHADQPAYSLFGYVIECSDGGFELITDDETWYAFTADVAAVTSAAAGVNVDDAVKITYTGDLNVNAQLQSVAVTEIAVLETLYGCIEDATASTTSVRSLQEDGRLYIFSNDDADIVVTDGGIVIGDEVEVAYLGALQPDSGQAQQLGYVHITVYGQIDDDYE